MAPVQILCPVKGMWSFMNPPGHHPDAKDFVAVDKRGKPYKAYRLIPHLFYSLDVEHTYAWSRPVASPFDGTVVKAENARTDRKRLNLLRDLFTGLIVSPRKHRNDPQASLGNHLIIRSDDGIFSVLAHLKQGSVTIEESVRVKAGDVVAEVGNSGNSIQPHLHFQLMTENQPFTSPPLPFILGTYEVRIGPQWITQHLSLPDNFNVFRTI